jgi:hypothetical protein
MNQKNLKRRYIRELLWSMVAYTFILIASLTILKQGWIQMRGFIIAISLAPVIPVGFVLLAIMRALRDSDELQQRKQLLATAFSAALTGFITFSYGFLENIGFPKFPTFLVFPMLIAIWGISLGYFSRKYQ